MTGLSRCGRVYPTFDAAYKAAEARSLKGAAQKVVGCAFADHWHVVPAASFPGRPPKRYRPDPFPPVVAKLIDARDGGLCQRCGSGGRLERHHRRAKGSGGSKARSHTQCPCNGLSLCWRCHRWAHEHPAKAKDLGIVVVQAVARPGAAVVVRWALSDSGCLCRPDDPRHPGADDFGDCHCGCHLDTADEQWLTCTGQWVHCPAETEE